MAYKARKRKVKKTVPKNPKCNECPFVEICKEKNKNLK